MARYIYFHGGNGYCGCDFEEVAEYDDSTLDIVIEHDAALLALENGEAYEHVATGYDGTWSDDECDMYYQDCWCNWDEITKEEYDEKKAEGL